jgi:hypothetical protein
MGWMLFEAMLALGAMLAVVWWTFRGRAERAHEERDAEGQADERQ